MQPPAAADVSSIGRDLVSASTSLEEAECKKENAMSDMTIQALVWIAAGTILVLYLKRRRKRKILP